MTIRITWDEKDIEDYLCQPIDDNKSKRKTKLCEIMGCENFVIIGRQVNILNFYIDILAYDTFLKEYFIIELKKEEIKSSSLAQALKYAKIFNSLHPHKKVNVLLIGQNLNEELYYILTHIKYYEETLFKNLYYTLYNFDFNNGLSFTYYDCNQENIYENLSNLFMENEDKKIEIYDKGLKKKKGKNNGNI